MRPLYSHHLGLRHSPEQMNQRLPIPRPSSLEGAAQGSNRQPWEVTEDWESGPCLW